MVRMRRFGAEGGVCLGAVVVLWQAAPGPAARGCSLGRALGAARVRGAEAGSRPAATRLLLLRPKQPGFALARGALIVRSPVRGDPRNGDAGSGRSGRTPCATAMLRSNSCRKSEANPKACASWHAHALGLGCPLRGVEPVALAGRPGCSRGQRHPVHHRWAAKTGREAADRTPGTARRNTDVPRVGFATLDEMGGWR